MAARNNSFHRGTPTSVGMHNQIEVGSKQYIPKKPNKVRDDLIRIAYPLETFSSVFYQQLTEAIYCDVPGSPCLSKTGPVVDPSFLIFGSLLTD